MLTEDAVGSRVRTTSPRMASRTATRRASRTKMRFLVAGLIIVAAVGYMIYAAIQSGSEYYVTTGELNGMGDKAVGQQIKLGGRSVEDSIQWDKGANTMSFTLTDGTQTLPVTYKGIVPDSFQPGTDVILEGKLGADGRFQATSMLAKCASKYDPAKR